MRIKSLIYIFLLTFAINSFISVSAEISTPTTANTKPTILKVIEKPLNVDGKQAMVYGVVQPDGTVGYIGKKGDMFNVIVENHTTQPITLHWHGLIVPNDQDGVPYVTQPPIPPGQQHHYHFPLIQSGTYWLHSHFGLQEQQLMSAPFIIHDSNDNKIASQEVVMFLEDFTFRNPHKVLGDLRKNAQKTPADKSQQNMPMNNMPMNMPMNKMNMPMDMSGMSGASKMSGMKMDLNDVDYDAFLANQKTLTNPDVIKVIPHNIVRLRIINASASTNFFINLGNLTGKVIAVDGQEIAPITGSKFQLAMAQRLDILVQIPSQGVFPILAQGEGTKMQTGLILATADAKIPKISETAATTAPAFDYTQESKLHATNPLPKKPIDRTLMVNLQGDMVNYVWKINNQLWPDVDPLKVKNSERVEMIFNNETGMSHPMHFHGHIFQVTEINGKPTLGAKRDTVLVLPHTSVKVQFDADNPGIWMLHCHNLYHMVSGMMTTVDYINYPIKFTKEQQRSIKPLPM